MAKKQQLLQVQLYNNTDNDTEINLFDSRQITSGIVPMIDEEDYRLPSVPLFYTALCNIYSQEYISYVDEITYISLGLRAGYGGIAATVNVETYYGNHIIIGITETFGLNSIKFFDLKIKHKAGELLKISVVFASNLQMRYQNLSKGLFRICSSTYTNRSMSMTVLGKKSLVEDIEHYEQFCRQKAKERFIIKRLRVQSTSEQIILSFRKCIETVTGVIKHESIPMSNYLTVDNELDIVDTKADFILDYKTFLRYKILKQTRVTLLLSTYYER